MPPTNPDSSIPIPVRLLKHPATSQEDPYTTCLSINSHSPKSIYQPLYIPVLDHTLYTAPILTILDPLFEGEGTDCFPFGGFIFTSQRAVESFVSALTSIVKANTIKPSYLAQERLGRLAIPLYAVGPATALSLKAIVRDYLPECWIRGGDEAGTGEALAGLILRDHNISCNNAHSQETGDGARSNGVKKKKPLLFLTGAKHRDIIPKTLTSAPPPQRLQVQELIVYASTESPSFASDISSSLETTASAPARWIVVFSPMAGETLLRALGWLDDVTTKVHGPQHECWIDRRTFIASIGPTTKDYMKKRFELEVDVCAEKPSPEGVRKGIEEFMGRKGLVP